MPNSVKEFSVYSGWIVEAISVDGKKYGPDLLYENEKKIKLAPGEKIIKVKFGRRAYQQNNSFRMTHCLCQLMFYSNMNKKYGPFGRACSDEEFSEVNNLPDDWANAIIMHYYPWGFMGATHSPDDLSASSSASGLPEESCVKEFSVRSGFFVDIISVDGTKYGKSSSFGGSTKKIKLAPGEKITKVKYALMFNYFMCQLVFYSNMNKKYGPYGRNYGHYETDYYEVNNLPCDWAKAIIVHRFPSGFKGAKQID